jgi:maltose-binding protein MalE
VQSRRQHRVASASRVASAHFSAFRQAENICDNRRGMKSDDLLILKDDMVAFIEGHAMRRLPGFISEDLATVLWEDEENPDSWKDFVEMAKTANAPFVTMSEAKLEKGDIAMLIEQIREENFPDVPENEVQEAQYLLNYIGKIGYIQLGFAYQGVMFVHENSTEWYERYQQLQEFADDFGDMIFEDDEDEEEE